MSEHDVEKGTEYGGQVLASLRAQLDEPGWVAVLARLVAEGGPVAVERLAARGGWSVGQIQGWLGQHPGVEWDEQGRIVGFGLTLRPTPHKFTFEGRTVFGWCATDVLMFPVILGTTGIVESTCPVTGQPVRVEVTPDAVLRVDPPDAVVSEVRPTERVADVRADMCNVGHFFSSREAADGWLAQHPGGQVNSVVDDFRIHRQVMAELGWAAP